MRRKTPIGQQATRKPTYCRVFWCADWSANRVCHRGEQGRIGLFEGGVLAPGTEMVRKEGFNLGSVLRLQEDQSTYLVESAVAQNSRSSSSFFVFRAGTT
jgi:hypothetical protein